MRTLWVTLSTSALLAAPLAAQTHATVEVGFVSATLRTSDKGLATNTSAGISVGVAIDHDFSPHFSFAPELMYIQKGGKFTESDGVTDDVSLNYFEVPLLFRWTLARRSLPHSFLTAGPSLAIQSSCTDSYSGTDLSGSAACKSLGQHTGFKSFDMGLMIGAGIDIKRALLSVRYDIGLRNVSEEVGAGAISLKNRALSVVIGYTL